LQPEGVAGNPFVREAVLLYERRVDGASKFAERTRFYAHWAVSTIESVSQSDGLATPKLEERRREAQRALAGLDPAALFGEIEVDRGKEQKRSLRLGRALRNSDR